MEEYSEGKAHKSEAYPRNRNVNTVYSIPQAMGNTRISCTEFVYDERAYDCKCFLIFELPAYNNIRKNILLQISFCLTLPVNMRIFSANFEG